MLIKILREANHKSPWVSWLVTHDGKSAIETRNFLENCFQVIPKIKHAGIIKKIKNVDSKQIDATLYELIAYKLFYQLNLSPEYDPKIDGLTPDLVVEINEQKFFVDVFVRHTPSRTLTNHTHGYSIYDKGDAAREFGERITEKSNKYAKLNFPLLLVAFLGDTMLETANVEATLYGASIGDENLENQFPRHITCLRPPGGVLLPEYKTDSPSYPNLSAVVVCNWFDNTNRENPGKLLQCLVLHHWHPTVQVSSDTFHPFPQLLWLETSSGVWKPYLTAGINCVATFGSGNIFEFHEYKVD